MNPDYLPSTTVDFPLVIDINQPKRLTLGEFIALFDNIPRENYIDYNVNYGEYNEIDSVSFIIEKDANPHY